MSAALVQTLFYPLDLGVQELRSLVQGVAEIAAFDVVDFAAEEGGDAARELALPLLGGMDEIEVQRASLRLRARTAKREITTFEVTQGSGDLAGVILVLPSTLRLLEVHLAYPSFPQSVRNDSRRFTFLDGRVTSRSDGTPVTLRLVLRLAVNDQAPYQFGPPVFASPDFGRPGPLYGPTLGGLAVSDLGSQRFKAALGGVRGSVWLLQLAHGGKPDELQPVAFDAAVHRVFVDAAPTNLSVALAAADGEVPLWAHPEPLHRDAGEQVIDFTPLAQRHLQSRLAAAPSGLTLALPLRFHSDSGGELEVTAKTLSARYLVRPLGAEPVTLRLDGSWTDLELEAPAGRRPASGSGRLTARHLGRELNDRSAAPPLTAPTRGIRIDAERWGAAAVTVQPVPGADAGAVPLISARILVSAAEQAEAVVELRADAAGAPGAVIAGPLVRQIEAGFSDWLEFLLDRPLAFERPGERLWLVLRSNRGELRWFTGEGGEPPRISQARADTWAPAEGRLHAATAPLSQLFHVAPEPLSVPAVEVYIDQTRAAADLMAGGAAVSKREFVRDGLALPPAVLERLAAAGGGGRERLRLRLFSPAVVDLTVTDLLLSYDPYQTGAGG